MNAKEIIARRVAVEMQDGDVVNLGIGLPTMVANYLPEGINVVLQSENGFVGLSSVGEVPDNNLVNAGGQHCGINPGGAVFDSAMSFCLIRGGHVDVTVLGGLQVDQYGNLANWMVPGKMVPGMGGAMDLVSGAKKVIVAMEHSAKDGSAKILKECTLPLTGKGKVNLLVTELGVFRVIPEGLLLEEIAPGVEVETVAARTEAVLIISPNLKVMQNLASQI
ncbi:MULTISPECIES: 3-oxoacid CoA-transferase subunit B [Pelosinus]|uniref:3-oxoacid CoA-transferase, B subunit n=1 Tax=Pelosinus fermentans B4 TaxID=1149862 RepID=I8RE92_9FIRM|nr:MULTISPECIES: 3-oxoacid CoA-transferase subunit B [Pelosinus]EIW15845.1 3-oxoacid CoA-transferase, B subunit [Pelosinus fermentans B4]EIW27449.1 3-oxoacid CoA-transferase, B subunit [Pelosinus fermentans A11]OAM92594.1 3-oxoacid CoA-transferase, B subunit [Pelosinus fermentans DSM 17108]SDQ50229.1 acetate CoA/acetoacetate CoA-transferase beta subunit [Pelosinus fermentans]